MSSENSNVKVPDEGNGKVSSGSGNGDTIVASESSRQVSRVVFSNDQLDELSAEELRSHWRLQQSYIDSLEALNVTHEGECAMLRDSEEKLKQQLSDLALRERVLVRRLAAKEQDMQEYAGQLSEMKGGQAPGMIALRSALLDPAVNILLQKLRQELTATRTRLDDTQNELAAWKFTPDSNTGKRLMAKCRLLYQENEELGRMISSGRLAKLEGDLALQKSFSEEVKKSQSELDELLQDLDEDVEGMQSTIYYLQQELRKAKEAVANLEQENSALRNSDCRPKSPPVSTHVNGLAVHHNGKWCKSSEVGSESSDSSVKVSETFPHQVADTLRTSRDMDGNSVVNNNIEDQRKRTTSENSDEGQAVKKPRLDSHLSLHYNDDEVITNGDVSGQ